MLKNDDSSYGFLLPNVFLLVPVRILFVCDSFPVRVLFVCDSFPVRILLRLLLHVFHNILVFLIETDQNIVVGFRQVINNSVNVGFHVFRAI